MRNTLLITGLLCLAGCGSSNTEARTHAQTLSVQTDATTFEEFQAKMPSTITPTSEEVGDTRRYTWKFSDGSEVHAYFKAQGSNMVIYSFDANN